MQNNTRRESRGEGLAEGLLVDELGGLGGHRGRAIADGLVELMGAARLELVVHAMEPVIRVSCLGVGERHQRDAETFGILCGQVTGGIRHQVELCGHEGTPSYETGGIGMRFANALQWYCRRRRRQPKQVVPNARTIVPSHSAHAKSQGGRRI